LEGTVVLSEFDAAEERARLAAQDLLAASNDVIRRRSVSWMTARDEVDSAEVSRISHYLPSRKANDAEKGGDVVNHALKEIAEIVAAHAEQASSANAAAAEAESIRRLTAIADDCERRAISLRL
jgi:Mn-containing catalase